MALIQLADGGEVYFPGTEVDAGLYVISNVPKGSVLIETGPNEWFETSSDQIDLGRTSVTRPNVVVGDAGTRLRLILSNLAPWTPNYSSIDLISANTHNPTPGFQQYAGYLPDGGLPFPPIGATSADLDVDWSNQYLIDSAQGDVVRLSEIGYDTFSAPNTGAGFVSVGRVQRYIELPPFSMAAGQRSTVTASMSPVATSPFAIDLKRGEIAAMRPLVSAQAGLAYNTMKVQAVPLGVTRGEASEEMVLPLLLQAFWDAADTTDLSVSVQMANPYPPSWTVVGGPYALFSTTHPIVVGRSVTMLYGASTRQEGAQLAGPHRLLLSPPSFLAVDGLPATDQTLPSMTPTFSWGIPAKGVPTGYIVQLRRLFLLNGGSQIEFAEFVRTTGQTFRVPAGVLRSGQHYVLVVYAVSDPGKPPSAPFRNGGYPYSYIPTVSGTLIAP